MVVPTAFFLTCKGWMAAYFNSPAPLCTGVMGRAPRDQCIVNAP